MQIYKSIEQLIGNTPMLELLNIQKDTDCRIFAKLEYFNPTSSSKDRIALSMIESAQREGKIDADTVIIEPTSGNTGIGLAAICASRSYKLILTMPDTMSEERKRILRAFGAEIVLTEGKLGMDGAVKKAQELYCSYSKAFIPSQFENTENPAIHYRTTGPEIWKDTDGQIDIFVAAVGTGGTLSGTGKFLKEKNPDIKIVAVEPLSSPLLSGGSAGSHKIQGIGANFIPDTLDRNIYDDIICVSNEDAYEFTRRLAKHEGLFVGISSGAAMYAAYELAKNNQNKNIAVIFPDTGSRYLSTEGLF